MSSRSGFDATRFALTITAFAALFSLFVLGLRYPAWGLSTLLPTLAGIVLGLLAWSVVLAFVLRRSWNAAFSLGISIALLIAVSDIFQKIAAGHQVRVVVSGCLVVGILSVNSFRYRRRLEA